MIRTLRRLGVACGLICFASLAQAEFLPAKPELIASQVLHQDRAIEVYLPTESTQQPNTRFETLYVLDGDWNTKLVIEVVNFMHQLGMLPPIIVVSVPNYFDPHGINSRDRDLTPTASEEQERSGGAAEFLAFLKTELLPFVDQHYPTNRVHLVHGHSYGGLFLMYVLANDPQVFDGYLVLDPAMWWQHGGFKAGLHDRLAHIQSSGKAVYIAGRAGVGAKDMGLDDLEPILKASFPATLEWRMQLYEDETHDSLKLKATYDALKFAYGGYSQDSIEVAPGFGIVLAGHPVRVTVSGRRIDPHYTTDGSEPTRDSPRLDTEHGVDISDPGKLRVRTISTRGVFDRELTVRLKLGAALEPGHGLAATGDGWHYAFYPLEAWPTLATNAALRALRKGTATKEVPFKDLDPERVAGRIERNLVVPADGYYVFAVRASQARLRLGDMTLITNEGPDDQDFRSSIVPLKKGTYALSVDFTSATRDPSLYVAIERCSDEQPEWWRPKPWVELQGRR